MEAKAFAYIRPDDVPDARISRRYYFLAVDVVDDRHDLESFAEHTALAHCPHFLSNDSRMPRDPAEAYASEDYEPFVFEAIALAVVDVTDGFDLSDALLATRRALKDDAHETSEP